MVVAYVYFPGIPFGVLAADDRAMREIEDALRIAERSSDDMALVFARAIPGLALVHRHTDAERDRGQKLLAEVSDVILRRGHNLSELRLINVYLARERARRGDRDEAIPLMRAAVDQLVREGQLLSWGIPATGVLVETLLDRGAEGDVAEAEAAIERLAAAPADDGLVIRDIWLLRLRALLARAHGDDVAYRDLRGSLPRDGGIAWLRRTHRLGRGDDRGWGIASQRCADHDRPQPAWSSASHSMSRLSLENCVVNGWRDLTPACPRRRLALNRAKSLGIVGVAAMSRRPTELRLPGRIG